MAKRREIADAGSNCNNCFAVCPAGTIADEKLIVTKVMQSVAP